MIIEILRKYMCLDDDHIYSMINRAQKTYKMYYIRKKNGGHRQIFHPSKETKVLQYAIIDMMLSKIKVHASAMAYIAGKKSPLLENAKAHARYAFTLHLDFKNFFPSLKPRDLINALESEHISLEASDNELISKILFLSFNGDVFLSIGAPASPICSNIIMKKIDEQIERLAIKYNGCYTRYADDIWFSTDIKENRNLFYDEFKVIINDLGTPKLAINEDKTLYISKRKKRIITGLSITTSGDVVIPRDKKRIIRSLILKRKYGVIDERQNKYLEGYISFIRDNEPDYINKLIIKYGEEHILAK